MTNKEHCKATEIMLGLKPHLEIHLFMDGYHRSMGWAHRAKRHDYKIIRTMTDLYSESGGMEAAFHLACDLNLVTKDDLKVWQGIVLSSKPTVARRRGVKAQRKT